MCEREFGVLSNPKQELTALFHSFSMAKRMVSFRQICFTKTWVKTLLPMEGTWLVLVLTALTGLGQNALTPQES